MIVPYSTSYLLLNAEIPAIAAAPKPIAKIPQPTGPKPVKARLATFAPATVFTATAPFARPNLTAQLFNPIANEAPSPLEAIVAFFPISRSAAFAPSAPNTAVAPVALTPTALTLPAPAKPASVLSVAPDFATAVPAIVAGIPNLQQFHPLLLNL